MDFNEPIIISRLLLDAAKLGAMDANKLNGVTKSTINKQEACRRYGRARVEKWVSQGKLKKSKDDTWRIDPVMIEALNMELEPIYRNLKFKK